VSLFHYSTLYLISECVFFFFHYDLQWSLDFLLYFLNWMNKWITVSKFNWPMWGKKPRY
jgi:hypothetical protein